ncbi:molybdenum cofactor biosynthesis protein MoaB [Pirellulales bacterium]|nr:molybdenum cofactor biosynthesis protein MoaB [Pirellulales bacterium]
MVAEIDATGLYIVGMSKYDSPSARQHRAAAPTSVRCAVITLSDTRTLENDASGDLIVEALAVVGHDVAERRLIPDEPDAVASLVQEFAVAGLDAVLITGGTGIAQRDQTPEGVARLFTKTLPGFGELFRMLSYQEIGAAAMLSRALGGVVGRCVVLVMPGSTAAVRLAMEKLVAPELAHLVEHAR